MTKSMESIKLPLSDAQLRKLAKGQGVRINPSANCSAYDVWCGQGKCRKMARQMTKGKGFNLKLDPEEMDANEIEIEEGGRINWKKIGRTLRSTAKSVGKFYREKIRPKVGPVIRKTIKEAIQKGIPLAADALATMTGQPEIGALAKPAVEKLAEKVAESGTEKLSKLTGAFGLKMDKSLAKQIAKMEHPKQVRPSVYQLQDNYSGFLNPNHPGMSPAINLIPDNSLPLIGRGLFMKGKGLFMRGNGLYGYGMRGMPMDPLLPLPDNSTYQM